MNDLYFYRDCKKRIDTNIYIRQYGKQVCPPNHAFGPAARDHFLLHFVVAGTGKFHHHGNIYDIKSEQCFLISPGEVSYYIADASDPWSYYWIGFSGSRAEQYLNQLGLNQASPIIDIKELDFVAECMEQIIESSKLIRGSELKMLGYLYLMLSKLYEDSKRPEHESLQDDYIKKAIEFIEMNYTYEISIKDIASHLNLNRSYFSSLFSEKLNISPQKYLMRFRIDKACDFLLHSESLSVQSIALSVGYPDALVFSKTFKKLIGMSPSVFRAEQLK